MNVPTDAGAAGCAICGSRGTWVLRGGPPGVAVDCVTATEGDGDPSNQPEARRLCLLCVCFFLESRVDLGMACAKMASSLSDGSESS